MEKVNDLISKNPVHFTTNTILLIVLAIVAFYVVIKVLGGLIKIIAVIAVIWFALMALQSTNLVNIPLIKQTYTAIEKMIPAKALWTGALNGASKLNKAVNDLK